jgi:hypothetical protein
MWLGGGMRSRLGNWVTLRKLPCFDTVFPLVLHDAVDWRGNKVISDKMVIHQLDCLLVILLDGLSAMRCRIDAIGYRRCLTLVQPCKQPRFPDSLQGPPHKWALTTQLCIGEKTVMPN